MPEVVRYEVTDSVAWLTMARPQARNALDAALREGLLDGFRRFQADPEAAVLVLTGEGEAFCAGGDLDASAEHPRSQAYEHAEGLFAPVYLSDDAQEGPRAFREKRPPVWKGR